MRLAYLFRFACDQSAALGLCHLVAADPHAGYIDGNRWAGAAAGNIGARFGCCDDGTAGALK